MEFCGMKREIDRKCLNHARVMPSRLTAVQWRRYRDAYFTGVTESADCCWRGTGFHMNRLDGNSYQPINHGGKRE